MGREGGGCNRKHGVWGGGVAGERTLGTSCRECTPSNPRCEYEREMIKDDHGWLGTHLSLIHYVPKDFYYN